jgi:hypothetical protein
MKNLFLFVLVFISSLGYSQDKVLKRWYSTADIEFINPNKVEYLNYPYKDDGTFNINENLNPNPTFGILYSINYNIFKKLSLGAATGLQSMNKPNYSMLKLGGIIKYFFADNDNVYVYLDMDHEFSLNKKQFKEGFNTRVGIGFPIMKRDSFNLNINVFYEVNQLDLEGSKPLIDTETPESIIFRSYGASVGIKF